MNKLILYSAELSPPCRAVLLTAKEIGIEFEIRTINLFKGDQRKLEFLKISPTHTIPALEDNGVYIFDSHAIMSYLVDKYAKNDHLYPKDLVARAKVHEALYLDTGVLFARFRFLFEPILYGGATNEPQEKIDYIEKGYGLIEAVLANRKYLAGENLSIGDFACMATLTSIVEMVIPFDKQKYPKLTKWFETMKEIPYFDEINQKGVNDFKVDYLRILDNNREKTGM